MKTITKLGIGGAILAAGAYLGDCGPFAEDGVDDVADAPPKSPEILKLEAKWAVEDARAARHTAQVEATEKSEAARLKALKESTDKSREEYNARVKEATEAANPHVTDVDEAREDARRDLGQNSCSTAEERKIKAAQSLVEIVTHQDFPGTTYQCAPGPVILHGHEVAGFVVSEAGEHLTLSLTPNFFESWRHTEAQATVLHTLEVCSATGACDSYTGPGDRFYPGGAVGIEAEQFEGKAKAARTDAIVKALKEREAAGN